jgi:hypothetical protein
MIDQQYTLDVIRDREGRKVRLNKTKLAMANEVWNAFKVAQDRFAVVRNRSNYIALRDAGANIVEIQSVLGIWLVHPDNARPGLAEDDERIVEDVPGLKAEIARLKAENAELQSLVEEYRREYREN